MRVEQEGDEWSLTLNRVRMRFDDVPALVDDVLHSLLSNIGEYNRERTAKVLRHHADRVEDQ